MSIERHGISVGIERYGDTIVVSLKRKANSHTMTIKR